MSWVDVIFETLYPIVLAGLAFHFIMSIFTGRFKNSFILGNWPHHDEPHPPALPKFMHFQHMVLMIVLAITGLYIHYNPFAPLALRYIHYFAMVLVTINLLWRFWYAFFSKNRDRREFAIGKKDVMSMLGVMKYYAYLSNDKPHVAKYNVLQKGSYDFFALMMIAQAFTGFALMREVIPVINLTTGQIMVGWWLGPLVGGTAAAVSWLRIVHYLLNWLFIVITTIHVYLSATVDIPVTLDFFGLGGSHDEEHDTGHGEAEPALAEGK